MQICISPYVSQQAIHTHKAQKDIAIHGGRANDADSGDGVTQHAPNNAHSLSKCGQLAGIIARFLHQKSTSTASKLLILFVAVENFSQFL
jgi:hypothetical protein